MTSEIFENESEELLRTRIRLLQQELSASRTLTARLRAGLETSRGVTIRLQQDLASLQAQAPGLEQALAEISAAADLAAAEVQALSAEREVLAATVASITGSLSWRLTKPLRAAARAARQAVAALRSPGLIIERPRQHLQAWRGRRAIAKSGLFDAQWYLAEYPDVAATGEDPLIHYLNKGWLERRTPGLAFDPHFYLARHPDVAATKQNPLAHYVLFGRPEGREARPVGEWTRQTDCVATGEIAPILPSAELAASDWPRIVVAIHAFYPDVFDAFCSRLAAIPVRFTLLASTPTAEAKAAVERSITAHGLNADADVRVTTNRGRNFGPLLSEFGPKILEHDLLLHLHTKKSLHNATGEQIAWREDIFRGLIGPGVLESIVGLFATRPTVGLVYPRTFHLMAYWANHWLQNIRFAAPLFERLGVVRYTDRGYINYPVGGMFWARVEAIRPLFEAGFTYEDFPPEAGQLDGTIAHAIERCFVDLARWRGFTFVETLAAENCFRIGWSDCNLDRYALSDLAGLKHAISRRAVISFDLFDTVLIRPSLSPDAVQRYVGVRLAAEHPAAPDFFAARKAAEHEARAAKGFLGDVDLDEIYAQMAAAPGWTQEALRRARELELETELPLAGVRPPVVAALGFARAQGKRVIAVSDTYFSRAEIDALLAAAGLENAFDAIYLSNEKQARKDRGDLWAAVLAAEGADPAKVLHIGDNEVSDMQRAGDAGLAVYHAMNPATLLGTKQFLPVDLLRQADGASGWTTALLLGPLATRLAADPYPQGGALSRFRIGSAHDLGYAIYGPILFAFTAWLARQAQESSVQRLYFLSREGWVLKPLFELFKSRSGLPLPDARYLYASRRTVLMAAQADKIDAERVIEGPEFNGTLGGLLLARLGFEMPAGGDLDPEAAISLPADAPAVRAAIDALGGQIAAQAQAEARAMSAYLGEQGLAEPGAAVVDVGYRATIQKGLQAALGAQFPGFYMATFPEAQQAGAAVGMFDSLDPLGEHPMVRHAMLLEAFMTAPEPQLDYFRLQGDAPTAPVFKLDLRTGADLASLADMHAGAMVYAEDLFRLYGPQIATLDFDPLMALEPLAALAQRRISVPSSVLEALRVDDAFCGFEEHQPGKGLAS